MPYDINETHDPKLKSWVESANDPNTDFPIQNLPWCAFYIESDDDSPPPPRIGMRIGDRVLDVSRVFESSRELMLDLIPPDDEIDRQEAAAASEVITSLMESGDLSSALGFPGPIWSQFRRVFSNALRAENSSDPFAKLVKRRALFGADECVFETPSIIADYTDFYASVHHASNVGAMFRPDNALLPNYKWVPIGYHGRASSIVPSGTPIRRPSGQTKADDAAAPTFGPCKLLDYELEVGFFVGPGNELGEPIAISEAEDHIFGLCLVNDWSARDMQKWEYQPLGPFLAKNFATSISPYIVTMEALAPFRCPAMERPAGDPRPLPYLFSEESQARGGVDIQLEVFLASADMRTRGLAPVRLSRGSFKHMYWTIAQLLTHHASNGCNMRPGDLLASGTVSGPSADSRGCLLELTWGGNAPDGKPLPRKPITLPTGETRTFLADGDEVIIKGFCEREGFRRIGFGECRGIIEPAK